MKARLRGPSRTTSAYATVRVFVGERLQPGEGRAFNSARDFSLACARQRDQRRRAVLSGLTRARTHVGSATNPVAATGTGRNSRSTMVEGVARLRRHGAQARVAGM